MNCLSLRGGSYRRIAQCCGSVTKMLFGAEHGMRSMGFRLVLPMNNRTIHGGGYLSFQSTSTQREGIGCAKESFKSLGFRIATSIVIAPPSQQPKVISLISIAVCDDGSISIHIGKQQGL